jgi:DNA-binding MarR family transcriptional regulator
MRILGILASSPTPMLQLAEAVLVEGPTLTKIIDRMVAESLVSRAPDPGDRRRVMIHMTDRGRMLHRRLSGITRKQQQALLARLDGDKAEQLQTLLRGLISDQARDD